MEGFLGEIRLFGGNFAPDSWAFCDGRSYSVHTYQVLYSILGTKYGGDGINDFKVPDLRGRVAIGVGAGTDLPIIKLGDKGGAELQTMTFDQMPIHTHIASASIAYPAYSHEGDTGSPQGSYLAGLYGAYSTELPDTHMSPALNEGKLSNTGSGLPFSIIQPVTALNYIICIEGYYPVRS